MIAELIDPAVLGFILIGVMLFAIFVGFPIYDMEKIEDQLWLGTSRGVFIFYTKNPQVLNINSIGRKTFPDNLYNVSSIKKFKNIVYIVSDKGVVTFDLESK